MEGKGSNTTHFRLSKPAGDALHSHGNVNVHDKQNQAPFIYLFCKMVGNEAEAEGSLQGQ